jgi:hypothetical protein
MDVAARRRVEAATRYQPNRVELLLVAEAPPAATERYFYFEDVPDQDSLFRHVIRAVLSEEPSRTAKASQLTRFRDAGVSVIDLKPAPKEAGETLEAYVPDLVARAVALSPARVITIKANVFDLCQQPLRAAGLHVAGVRVPFPGSGQQRRFLAQMSVALAAVGWPPPVVS